MEFYVIINDQEQGPFTMDQLATMGITPETEVWTQGMADWQQAGDVPALTTLLQQLEFQRHTAPATPPARAFVTQPRPVPQPQYEPIYEPQYEPQQPAQQPKRRKGMGCLLWSSLVLIILLAVMVVTVPSREDHVNTIKDVTREWMDEAVGKDVLGSSILSEVTKWVGGNGADMVIDHMFSYDNYIVCSVGKFNYAGRSRRVSLGMFGHVFTFDKDDITNVIKATLQGKETEQPASEPSVGVSPPVEEIEPAPLPDDDSQVDDDDEEAQSSSNPAQDIIDTLANRAKREAIRAAKEWAKKRIDEM